MTLYESVEALRQYLSGITDLVCILGSVEELIVNDGASPDQFIAISPTDMEVIPSDSLAKGELSQGLMVAIYYQSGKRDTKARIWETSMDAYERIARALTGFEIGGYQIVEITGARISDTEYNSEHYELEMILKYKFNTNDC